MERRFIHLLVAMLAVSLVFVSGCDEEEEGPTTPGQTTIRPASNPQAFSASSTSVGVAWTASPDESSSDVLNPAYRIIARDTLGSSSVLTAVKGQSTVTFTGLVEGRVYTFSIKVLVGAGAVSNDSVTVKWAPAKRRNGEGTGSTPIQVFETASSSFPSGLDVYSSTEDGPVTRSLTGATNSLIDLFVFTDTGSSDLLIRSAHLSSVISTPKTTFFSTVSVNADDLDNPQSAPPDPSTYSIAEVRIASGASATGRIIYGRTQEGNYFRLLVVRTGGTLVQGTSPDRFLTFRVSYQSVTGVIYSRPIHLEDESINRGN